VVTNQYGRGGRAARNWGVDTIEGDLPEEELIRNRHDQTVDNVKSRFLDDEYYATKDYNMADIKVPILSVGNWGGILLHLRGNVHGYLNASSKLKYLRFVTGRHDLPFYEKENVSLQKSFLDAFLKDHDDAGWATGEASPVGLVVRKGDPGYNDAEAEKAFPYRYEKAWPLPDTQYIKFYMTRSGGLDSNEVQHEDSGCVSYQALGDLQNQSLCQFTTEAFTEETEFTGHIVVHLNVSVTALEGSAIKPNDMDFFITLRHLRDDGQEVLYTGTVGDPVPITKGWLRVSLRNTDETSARNTMWYPHRQYLSSDESLLEPEKVYPVDVEVWPTNVVIDKGGRLVLEISSGDTQGAGLFEHNSLEDRPKEKFEGMNHIHFGPDLGNWVLMPLIPHRE
jgi:predicted acyl esterase